MSEARITEMLETNKDDVSGSFAVVSEQEKFTHDGLAFYSSATFTLAAGQTINLLGETDGRIVHMKTRSTKVISLGQTVDVSTVLYEGSDYAGGANVEILNVNRNSDTISTFIISQGSTGTTKGIDIKRGSRIVASKDTATTEPRDDEYIMKTATKYLLEATNNASQSCEVSIFWSWFEV